MKSTRFYYVRTIKRLEHREVTRHVGGFGKEAEFVKDKVGWYAHFVEDPASLYLGTTETGLAEGDVLRITAEKV